MATQAKGVSSLKVRSKSMPLVSIMPKSPQIQRLRQNRRRLQDQLQHELSHNKQIFGIQDMKNQEIQQLNNKMKAIAERSMKKLQEKYETIDKWKQKYVPQSSLVLIRHKLSLDGQSTKLNIDDKKPHINQEPQLQKKDQLLPIIIKKPIAPTMPDQKEQGKMLEDLLKQRLQKNKRYYELRSTIIEKQINYFQDINTFIAPQKKRQLQLRKLLLKSQRDGGFNRGLFYQKLSLSEPQVNKQQKTKKVKAQQKQKQRSKINDESEFVPKKGSTDIYQLKAKLMEEVVGATPEGWNTIDILDSPEQQGL